MMESYINFMTEIGRYLLGLITIPRVRHILLPIFGVGALQVLYSFIVIPIKRWNTCDLYFANDQIWYYVCWDNFLIIMENH